MEAGQTQRAAALAEKFQDLELLVQLCVREGDMPRLHHYMDKYKDQVGPANPSLYTLTR